MARTGEQAEFSLRRIAVPAFGPSAIWSIGAGAVLPVVALSARGLGASVGLAALFVGITTLSEFAAAVPAGVLVERIGERRALVLAGRAGCRRVRPRARRPLAVGARRRRAPAGAHRAPSSSWPGRATSTAAAPVALRARAMSTLGGVTRIGLFVGPLDRGARRRPLGAAGGLRRRGRGRAARRRPGLAHPRPRRRTTSSCRREHERVPVRRVVAQNRRVLLTVGLGVLAIGLARSSRVVVVPLWAEHVGLDAAQTSLVFAAAAFVEVVLFYPAGTVMDRHGRVWVAVPVTLLLGLGLVALPLTTTLAGVAALALLMGVGNGLGSGIVMTLGADAAPTVGRAPFLGVWRLLSLVGHNGAALVVGAVAAVATIGVASVAVGLLTLVGGAWLARWLPEYDPRRRAPASFDEV